MKFDKALMEHSFRSRWAPYSHGLVTDLNISNDLIGHSNKRHVKVCHSNGTSLNETIEQTNDMKISHSKGRTLNEITVAFVSTTNENIDKAVWTVESSVFPAGEGVIDQFPC